jgi:hypothetical protein
MKLVRRAVMAAMLFVPLIAGCGDDDDEDFGVVTAEWSISDGVAASDCARVGADFFEAAFFTRAEGLFVAEIEEDCRSFSVRFEMPAGTYDVTTRLITSRQEAVSDTLFFDEVLVESGVEAVLHADFPPGSVD